MSHDITKPTKWVCAQRRLRSAWASAQSDQSLRCALNGWLRTQDFFMWTATTLIGLGLRLVHTNFVGFVVSRLKLDIINDLYVYVCQKIEIQATDNATFQLPSRHVLSLTAIIYPVLLGSAMKRLICIDAKTIHLICVLTSIWQRLLFKLSFPFLLKKDQIEWIEKKNTHPEMFIMLFHWSNNCQKTLKTYPQFLFPFPTVCQDHFAVIWHLLGGCKRPEAKSTWAGSR